MRSRSWTERSRRFSSFWARRVSRTSPGSAKVEAELAEGDAVKFGVPGDPVPMLLHLPDALVDRLLFALQRRTIDDLSAYGLPRPTEGAMVRLKAPGVTPAVVDREILETIRGGAIECVPAVVGLDDDGVVLAGGRRVPADAAATGYRTGLEDLVGGLGLLGD